MRTSYVSGDAWCIVHGGLLVVLDRGLDAPTATAIHAVMTPAGLRDEPLALAVLEPVVDGWLLWRRRGVPAVADAPLPERGGETWGSDLLPIGTTVAFGAVGALDEAMPLEGGVVRASAVRVDLVAAADDDAEVVGAIAPHDEAEPSVVALPQPAPEPEPEPEPAPEFEAESEAEPAPEPEPAPESEPAPAPDGDVATDPAATSGAAPASEPDTAVLAAQAAVPEPVPGAAPTPESAPDRDSPVEPEPTPAREPLVGIIDSVPGFIRPATVVEVPDDVPMGDHDGMTIAGDAARALAAAAREQQTAPPVLGPATGPVVLSTLCAAGHVNPPGGGTCACGAAIASESADQRARPEFAELVLPDGDRVPLGRGVVLGRRPRSRRVEDGRVPRLVTVHSPSEDISRSHLEVRCEDWNVLAIDLESTNGTVLLRDGAAPMRLRADAPQLVAFGDRLDLGDGVVVRIERARTAGAS